MKLSRLSRQTSNVFLVLILFWILALGSNSTAGASPVHAKERGEVSASPQNAPSPNLHIRDRYLLSANNVNLIMRGINHPHTWFRNRTGAFQHIKAKGANAVRVVLSSGKRWTKNSATDVGNVIRLCKTNRLICVLEVHDTTGYGEIADAATLAQAVAYWKGIKSALIEQEPYVIINLGNEPYGHLKLEEWVPATRSAITAMRAAGFKHTLMVDAPNWGQDDSFTMRDKAARVLAADPDRNTIFSVHMFGSFETTAEIEDYILHFVRAKLPLVIGEFGHFHTFGDPNEDEIMRLARKYGIGYLGWSWSGNNDDVKPLDMVINFDPAQMTWWGRRIINGPNGIRLTSVEASIYSGERNPRVISVTRADPNPTGLASVRFTVTFSEAVTGVNMNDFRLTITGVTGAAIASVSGSGATYTVTVNTGSGNGTIRLDVLDNDTILDAKRNTLGGPGPGYGNFKTGETYTVIK